MENELAYLAGFFDGEGCVHIGRSSMSPKGLVYYRMTINIAQMDPSPLHAFAAMFGGSVTKTGAAWQWQRVGWKAIDVLERLLPYLRQKSEQARLALIFQRQMQGQKRGAVRVTPAEQAERASFDEAFSEIRHQHYTKEGLSI